MTELTPPDHARLAVRLGILRIASNGGLFPGRKGKQGSRYLVDSRGAGSNVRLRNVISAALAEKVLAQEQIETIVALAKSGITWGAWLAQSTGLPYATVLLDGPRTGGLQREIEGNVGGKKIILVDNWVSSGESLLQAASVVERHGGEVSAAVAVSGHICSTLPFPVLFAFHLSHLLAAAAEQNIITESEVKLLIKNESE